MDHKMARLIANAMIMRQTKWQWSQKHSLGSNHDEWNQYQWTNTVEIYKQGILARYDWIREPMDPQMGKLYTIWILARLYLRTITKLYKNWNTLIMKQKSNWSNYPQL